LPSQQATLGILRDARLKIEGGEPLAVGLPRILPIIAGFGRME
jgi:hypothetical protein